MSRIKRPYRTVDPRLPVAGPGAPQDLGFVQTVQGKLAQLKRDVMGLRDRLRYRYGDGVPASYVGEKVFEPEDATFTIDNGQMTPTMKARRHVIKSVYAETLTTLTAKK